MRRAIALQLWSKGDGDEVQSSNSTYITARRVVLMEL